MLNGEERYCRNDVDSGSHISRTRVSYTMAQLQSQGADNRNNISSQIQNATILGTAVGAGAPTGGADPTAPGAYALREASAAGIKLGPSGLSG